MWLSVRFAHPDDRLLNRAATVALGLFLVQIAVGGVVALADEPALGVRRAHRVRRALARRFGRDCGAGVPPRRRRAARALARLRDAHEAADHVAAPRHGSRRTRARSEGLPSLGLTVATLGGLALACGGASALNHVLDRDIDRLMGERTQARPVASGRVAPARALEFGLALLRASFVVLACYVNLLTAVLALVGGAFYVLVYTRWLKRSTPQNIVIGGAAGAVPPVVGWTAATGHADPAGAAASS